MVKKNSSLLVASIFSTILWFAIVSANTYISDVSFTIPNSVYVTNERIELKGNLTQSNYTVNGTLVSYYAAVPNATINLTIRNTNGTFASNTTLTTDSYGLFYTRSNVYTSAPQVLAPASAGDYYIRAQYTDPNGNISFSQVQIVVLNQSIDRFRVSSNKAVYNPSETVNIEIEAIKEIGDIILPVSNISVNGTLRNLSQSILSTFNCTTGTNGKCYTTLTAPSTYGVYTLEVEDFSAFSSFSVAPFIFTLNMKNGVTNAYQNIFALGEQAKVEVKIANASSSDAYTFSGYITNSNGENVKTIIATQLNNNNSFTNSFLFTVDALTFSYGAYSAHVTVTKTGDGSIDALTSFEVRDWALAVNKKSTNSGFEYAFSAFPNKTLRLEASPTYRSNGSVIPGINSTSFSINLKDSLNNVVGTTNTSWNASCGTSGCYEFSLTSPTNTGQYKLLVTLSYSGDIQTESRTITVISGVMTAQSTDKDGNIKELFGTNEYVYISLSAYNQTSLGFNLTDAEVSTVSYMNGSDFSYTQVDSFALVNNSNSALEWAWNSSLQRLKLDVSKAGGLYTISLLGNNRTLGAEAKFILNPYDVCAVPKNTPGSVSGSGYYYVWQFKTTDTVYYEIKVTEANNPLGRATASNNTAGNGTGLGAACNVNTQTSQVVNNATITIVEVTNLESGAIQGVNSTESVCQASDSSGGYSCTIKPLNKWDGGQNIVKFSIRGADGTTTVAYSRFEARAFYLYGWSQNWQNSPNNNITLNIQIYEAGRGWWGGGGSSGGLSGTVTVKRVEYQGRDGEWIWPPVDSGYNVSRLNSSSITNGYNTLSLPVSNMPSGVWPTGYYRVVMQATTSAGDTDYGYAWFGVKLWDVYGQPIECTTTACNYKSYFNSKENITLYVKISQAGNYNYNDYGGASLGGNVSVGIKKIQDCRRWPCKDLNSTQYTANSINVNASSPWYWNANILNLSRYIIQINSTSGTWGSGYYNVVLDVNGTDTGYAWFNTIAFYVESQPTDINGTNYKYSIRGNQPMYFNVTTTKSYKYQGSYWNGSTYIYSRYNASDYVNTTFDSVLLRTWDYQTQRSKEYNYPQDLNITPLVVNGNALINLTYRNGSWPTGYYWGELTMKNSNNETSTGWLWFNVQPFRVQVSSNSYNVDTDQCVNASVSVYEPDWYASSPLISNYSIISIYENIWSYSGSSRTNYNNYTNSTFNATTNIVICPNSGQWGGGSWGGYHYLNILVKDNIQNDSQSGWLSFRTIPFQVTWGGTGGSYATNQNLAVSVSLTKPLTGANTTGNLTRLYQWRWDNGRSSIEEYVFKIGSCYSNVSGQCTVNGTQNVTVYAPSAGWRVGYNYIYGEWTKDNDASVTVQDWSGIYFDGRETYNGYYANSDSNGNYKYDFNQTENITIRVYVRDVNYNSVNVNITGVQYALSSSNCYDEWCRSYTSATFSPTSTANGNAILKIAVPSGGWAKGTYYIKTTVSGSAGSGTILGGNVRVKDPIAPNITISSPVNNATYTNNSLSVSFTTSESARCNLYFANYNNFYSWYCGFMNSTNSTNSTSPTSQSLGACNSTLYNYNGTSYYTVYVSDNYYSTYDGQNSTWSNGATGFSTGGTTHTYTANATNWPNNQHYGLQIWCNDEDYNYVNELAAFKINRT